MVTCLRSPHYVGHCCRQQQFNMAALMVFPEWCLIFTAVFFGSFPACLAELERAGVVSHSWEKYYRKREREMRKGVGQERFHRDLSEGSNDVVMADLCEAFLKRSCAFRTCVDVPTPHATPGLSSTLLWAQSTNQRVKKVVISYYALTVGFSVANGCTRSITKGAFGSSWK